MLTSRTSKVVTVLALCVAWLPSLKSAEPSKKYLEPWQQGVLDIHHINTGTGESTFFQLPDGTNLLVDTGIHTRPYDDNSAKPLPNQSKQPGEWVARYIQSLYGDQKVKLNYVIATHFDQDHIGGIVPGLKPSEKGDYLLTGLSEVVEHLPAERILDRGYPSYDYPKPLVADHIINYRRFVEQQVKHLGTKAERFVAGSNDQIRLLNAPEKFPNFKIQNLAVNGEVWTGKGTDSTAHFPPLEELQNQRLPSENASSLAFKLSYGKFDYFTGGDILGVLPPKMPAWADIETPIAKVAGQIEAVVANHHAYLDSMNEVFLRSLAPQVQIILSWDNNHPHHTTLPRMISKEILPKPSDLFITNLIPAAQTLLGPENSKHFKSIQGHIVIRVAADGDSYQIYILNDQSEDRFVLATFGPYLCQP